MRLSHCESYCGPPLCYIPCLPKSKEAAGDAAPKSKDATGDAVPAAAEEKPPPVQKIEEAVAEKDDDDSKEVDDVEEDDVKTALPPAPLKSNLKKADCADSKCAEKGNVKWLDLLGKDLTEVKEFEPSESGDSMDEDDIAECVCAIQ